MTNTEYRYFTNPWLLQAMRGFKTEKTMIANTDIRLGNLIRHAKSNSWFIVKSIGIEDLIAAEYYNPANSGSFFYNDVDGIPFSKELLNHFKWFEDENEANYYKFYGRNPIVTSKIDGLLDIEFPYDNSRLARVWTYQDRSKAYHPGTATVIEYFHELQNLIHGITKKELLELIK